MLVRNIQKAIKSKQARWTAGHTSISQLSFDEFKRLLGTLVIPPVPEEKRVKPVVSATLPSKFDWRNKDGEDWTTTIKDQNGCGSCVPHALLAAMEAQYNIQTTGSPNTNRDLSEQFLISCCPYIKHSESSSLSDVLNWLKVKWKPNGAEGGVPDEDCFPYQADDTVPCSNVCSDYLDRLYHIKDWYYTSNNITDTKNFILSSPVCANMNVYEDFAYYTGGVYEHVWGRLVGYHEVVIVGWDDSNSCWICKNSWGTDWGESGWFRIKYGECFIEGWVIRYDRVGRGFGSINCTTTPSGAEIILDGVSLGKYTPYRIDNIAADYTYTIKFRLEGYGDCVTDVHVYPNTVSNAHCDMSKLPPTPKPQIFDCIFPRIYTGKPFPRIAQANPIPRITCLLKLYMQ